MHKKYSALRNNARKRRTSDALCERILDSYLMQLALSIKRDRGWGRRNWKGKEEISCKPKCTKTVCTSNTIAEEERHCINTIEIETLENPEYFERQID